MRIGITGTRDGMTDQQAAVFLSTIRPTFNRAPAFHHGSCKGVDVQAARIADECGFWIVCHPGPEGDHCRALSGVDDETRPPKNHFARNRDIVNETDQLIACPREMQHQPRGGTWYTIDYARKVGKPVTIIWPDGSVTPPDAG